MTDTHKGVVNKEDVADNWEEAGEEVAQKFFDERRKEVEAKKQEEEEMSKAREAAQLLQEQGASCDKPAIQILKRPSAEAQSQRHVTKHGEKAKPMTLQEKEAAYLQARERIFGGVYRFEDDRDTALDPTLQIVPGTAFCVPTGIPLSHISLHSPNPRPRLPAIMKPTRPTLYQPTFPLGPPFGVPPPLPGAYTPPIPPISQQNFPLSGMQFSPNIQPQRFPYFDSRIPPPLHPPLIGQQNSSQNVLGINPTADVARNPVPYGRPPAQLFPENRFTLAFNDQPNKFL
ncbi:unnamed protein product [Thelazia callipaeda]|uniref:SUZ domain-containing protein n=1 Tax=Thelazia callipaeda TaxID=103827 RepID=A0A0N5CPN5_THECL|nr:unnamed protein product [Thelazia callipaeda]